MPGALHGNNVEGAFQGPSMLHSLFVHSQLLAAYHLHPEGCSLQSVLQDHEFLCNMMADETAIHEILK